MVEDEKIPPLSQETKMTKEKSDQELEDFEPQEIVEQEGRGDEIADEIENRNKLPDGSDLGSEGQVATSNAEDLSERFQSVGERGLLDEEPDPLTGLVEVDGEKWFPRGKLSSLVAPGEHGKTQILFQLAMCVASENPDRKWLGRYPVPDSGPVVIALGEESRRDINRKIHGVFSVWEAREELSEYGSSETREDVSLSDREKRSVGRNFVAFSITDFQEGLTTEPVRPRDAERTAEFERKREIARRVSDDVPFHMVMEHFESLTSDSPHEALEEIARKVKNAQSQVDRDAIWNRILRGRTKLAAEFERQLKKSVDAGNDAEPEESAWRAIIVDPASRFVSESAEQDSAAATEFTTVLEEWADPAWWPEGIERPSVIFSHHASQTAAEEDREVFLSAKYASRGSTALTENPRFQANLFAEEAEIKIPMRNGKETLDLVSVAPTKFNDGLGEATAHARRSTEFEGGLRKVRREWATFDPEAEGNEDESDTEDNEQLDIGDDEFDDGRF